MTDELPHDPWSRRYAGEHNAFLVRENGEHIEAAIAAITTRRVDEETLFVAKQDAAIIPMRKAA